MTVRYEIRDCNGAVIVAETGAATDTPSIGGTFLNPDIETWHPASNWCCEKLLMTVYQRSGCSLEEIRISSEESEFGVYVCGFKLQDCNGACIELGCLTP